MADKKISQLPVGEINSSTIFPLVTDGVTSQNSLPALADALEPYFSGGSGSQNLDQVLENGNTSENSIIISETFTGETYTEIYTTKITTEGIETRLNANYDGEPYNIVRYLEAEGTSCREYKLEDEFSEGDTSGGFSTNGGSYQFNEVFSTGSNFQQKGTSLDFRCYGDPTGNFSTTFKFPFNQNINEATLAITDDLPTSGSFTSTVTTASANVVFPGNTWVDTMYWTRVGNVVNISAEVSVEISADTSSDAARIVFSLPFLQSNDHSRTNVGNGVLAGGYFGDGIFSPVYIQMDDQNHAGLSFYGKSGNTSGYYQGEIRITYIVD